MKKVLRIIGNVVFYLIIIIIIIAAITLGKAKTTRQAPSILGYSFYSVVSGSMSPEIETGSVVIVKEKDIKDIEKQDIITFKNESNVISTHRVVDILNNGNNIDFITKGDANDILDPRPIKSKDVIGQVIFNIPQVGYMMVFIQNNIIKLLIVGIVLSIIVWIVKLMIRKNRLSK